MRLLRLNKALIALALILLAGNMLAQEKGKAKQPAPVSDLAKEFTDAGIPGYESRDPFWPLGVRPPQPKAEDKENPIVDTSVDISLDPAVPRWPELKADGVMMSPKGPMVVIKGMGIAEKGQIIKKTVSGLTYSWRIDEITKKGFKFTKLEAKPAVK